MKSPISIVRRATSDDKKKWNEVTRHPLQLWEWGEFRASMGIDVVRLVVEQNEKIIDGWQITFHNIPFTSLAIGYFPKGPLLTQVMLEALATLGKEKKAIFIQLESNVPCHCEERNDAAISIDPSTEIASLIARNDKLLKLSHHPLFTKYTFVLDLTKSEDELLKAMHPKTRYNIKVAQKHDVVIQENNSLDAFDTYLSLTKETTNRQGFYAHNETYHRRMWEVLHPAGIAKLFTATYQEKILAAWIIFTWNDTIYYPYGSSSRNHKDVMAPYLLLWEIAQWGKRNGYKKFDLWGAIGPHASATDPWYGFHRFKEGFSPQLVECTGSYDLILRPFLYRTYTILDTLRWKFLTMNRNV
ncbi:peptidoglycan bridge formation glycyltransferase FemA/FemB family protein [Candidatus Gottesmanbacteria bacterium]|nr:peptidoglycan bridge formation glycyltransferase FemA/FemB family protein [Candidatus Gottesmanbacteria bacterium]